MYFVVKTGYMHTKIDEYYANLCILVNTITIKLHLTQIA